MTNEEKAKEILCTYLKNTKSFFFDAVNENIAIDLIKIGLAEGRKEILDKYSLEKEEDVPEYSFIKSEYVCGGKPTFNVGDSFEWYCHCDIPGETDCYEETGCITNIVFKEGDWVYTFDDGDEMTEKTLIKINAKVCRK